MSQSLAIWTSLKHVWHTSSRTFRNTLYLLAGDWGKRFFSVAFTVILARTLGPSHFGQYGLAQDLTLALSPLIDLGLSTYLIREIARNHENTVSIVDNVFSTRVIVGVPVVVTAIAIGLFAGYSRQLLLLVLLEAVFIVTDSLSRAFRNALTAHERMEYEAAINFGYGGIDLLFTLLLVVGLGFGTIGAGLSDLLAGMTVLLVSYVIYQRIIKPPTKLNLIWPEWRDRLRPILTLTLLQLVLSIFVKLDSQILYHFQGETAVGILSASNKLVFMFFSISAYQVLANYPRLSQAAIGSTPVFRKMVTDLFRQVAYIGFALSAFLCLGASLWISLLYGQQYSNSTLVLRVGAWSPFLLGMVYALTYALIANNRQIVALVAGVVAIGALLATSLLLVPRFSYLGSAASTICALLVWLFCLLVYFSRHQYIRLGDLKPTRQGFTGLARRLSQRVKHLA